MEEATTGRMVGPMRDWERDRVEEDRSPGSEPRWSRPTVGAVIRRATEIELAERPDESTELTDDEVLRIGRDLGLGAEAVEQALAEATEQATRPRLLATDDLWSPLLGPASVSVVRRIDAPAELLVHRLEEHLRDREGFRPVRRRDDGSRWRPDHRLVPRLRGKLSHLLGRSFDLGRRARAVEIGIVPGRAGRSTAWLAADVRNRRAAAFGGSLAVALGIVAGLVTLSLSGLIPSSHPGLAFLGLALVSAAILASRHVFDRARHDTSEALGSVLDRVEAEVRPVPPPRPAVSPPGRRASS